MIIHSALDCGNNAIRQGIAEILSKGIADCRNPIPDPQLGTVSKLRDRGVTVPVIAGIMPVTNGRQIDRICRLSGTYLPSRFKAIVDRYGDRPTAMQAAGVAYATEQIIDLFANGVNAVHVYTMNKPEVAASIMSNLRGIL